MFDCSFKIDLLTKQNVFQSQPANWSKVTIDWSLGNLEIAKLRGWSGIHGRPGPGTDRSESVRDFPIFLGPGPVQFSPKF